MRKYNDRIIMLIIKINGGLGNQMFQYALFLKLKSLGKEVYLDDEIIVNKLNDTRALKINEVFKLHYPLCSKQERDSMADVSINLFSRLRRKVFGKRQCLSTYYAETDFYNNYHEEVYYLENKYLDGFWQSEKYFLDIRKDVLDCYTFYLNREAIKEILDPILLSNSVSIHVRRGDYVNNSIYEGVCTDDYYNKAIDYIKKQVDNPRFYIFSDDKEYVKSRFIGNEFEIVDGFKGNKAHYDMFLMSKCKHNIVANSSFSWWGAWLNQNMGKIVVCPRKWGKNGKLKYTPCDSWVKIEV